MANLIDPALIVMSGSVVKAGKIWWESLNEGFLSGAIGAAKTTQIVLGKLGDDAPLIGAACAVHKHINDMR